MIAITRQQSGRALRTLISELWIIPKRPALHHASHGGPGVIVQDVAVNMKSKECMTKLELLCAGSLAAVLIVSTPFVTGCARHRTTTVSTTTDVQEQPRYRHSDDYYDDRASVETTRTEEVTKDDRPHGFFGILGDIIALPFRAVGSIL